MLKQVKLYFYLRVTEQHSQLQITGFTIYKCVYLQYKMYRLYSVKGSSRSFVWKGKMCCWAGLVKRKEIIILTGNHSF